MAKNKGGRKTVMTPDVIRKIEEVAALDGSVEEMAYYAGIHPDTIYAHLKINKEFSDKITALKNKPVLKARNTVIQSLDNPDHAFKYLEKKRKKEFGNALDLTTGGEKLNIAFDKTFNDTPNTTSKTARSDKE